MSVAFRSEIWRETAWIVPQRTTAWISVVLEEARRVATSTMRSADGPHDLFQLKPRGERRNQESNLVPTAVLRSTFWRNSFRVVFLKPGAQATGNVNVYLTGVRLRAGHVAAR
jgi:uncharacterized protein YbjT (DUF2867 family)